MVVKFIVRASTSDRDGAIINHDIEVVKGCIGSIADSMTLTGFTGLDCEMNPDDCVRHQCQNGATCLDGLGTYTCLCPKTWKGELFRASSWQQQCLLPASLPTRLLMPALVPSPCPYRLGLL